MASRVALCLGLNFGRANRESLRPSQEQLPLFVAKDTLEFGRGKSRLGDRAERGIRGVWLTRFSTLKNEKKKYNT